jgi:hypothetical protein
MASDKHQFILGLVVKRMRTEGATIFAVDGNYAGLLGEKVSMPPQILRHRPDVIGVKSDGQILIGEAKTENDITNKRTYEQLKDFSSSELNGNSCEVFVGIPRSAVDVFNKCLTNWGLDHFQNIHLIIVPDTLIND